MVRRTRAELAENRGAALLGRRAFEQRHVNTHAHSASSVLHQRAVQATDWRTVVPDKRIKYPLATAAQSAESAVVAAIDAAEASRQRWEADRKLVEDLAARLEMAAQEIRDHFDTSADQNDLNSSWRSEQQPSLRSVRSSSSTDTTTGTWAVASSPAVLRRTLGQRPQTLRSNPYPALDGNGKSLAARAASPAAGSAKQRGGSSQARLRLPACPQRHPGCRVPDSCRRAAARHPGPSATGRSTRGKTGIVEPDACS